MTDFNKRCQPCCRRKNVLMTNLVDLPLDKYLFLDTEADRLRYFGYLVYDGDFNLDGQLFRESYFDNLKNYPNGIYSFYLAYFYDDVYQEPYSGTVYYLSCQNSVDTILNHRELSWSYRYISPTQFEWLPFFDSLGIETPPYMRVVDYTSTQPPVWGWAEYYEEFCSLFSDEIDEKLFNYKTIYIYYERPSLLFTPQRLKKWLKIGHKRLFLAGRGLQHEAMNSFLQGLDLDIPMSYGSRYSDYSYVDNNEDYADIVGSHYMTAGMERLRTWGSQEVIGGIPLTNYHYNGEIDEETDMASFAMCYAEDSEIYLSGCVDNLGAQTRKTDFVFAGYNPALFPDMIISDPLKLRGSNDRTYGGGVTPFIPYLEQNRLIIKRLRCLSFVRPE